MNIRAGIGSNPQDLDGDLDIILRTSSVVTGLNSDKGVPVNSGGGNFSPVSLVLILLLINSSRILVILSEKNYTNRSANSLAQSWAGKTAFLPRFNKSLQILKRSREFEVLVILFL